jgi:hypothetical protein
MFSSVKLPHLASELARHHVPGGMIGSEDGHATVAYRLLQRLCPACHLLLLSLLFCLCSCRLVSFGVRAALVRTCGALIVVEGVYAYVVVIVVRSRVCVCVGL